MNESKQISFLQISFLIQGVHKLFDLDSHYVFIYRDVVFYENIFPFSTGTSLQSTDLIPLLVIPIVHSLVFPNFPLSTTTSSSSSLSDDTIIQIHHDFDKDIQEFPNSTDIPIPLPAFDAPNSLSSASDQPYVVPRRSTRLSRPPSYLEAYHCIQVTSASIPIHSNLTSGTSHPL